MRRLPTLLAWGLVAVPGLLVIGASPASASPTVVDPSGCAALLAQAEVWPGTFSTSEGTVRLFSDGYFSFLLAQPPCARLED